VVREKSKSTNEILGFRKRKREERKINGGEKKKRTTERQ